MLKGKDWFKVDGASLEELQELDRLFNNILPAGLIDLLRYSNGGEGPLAVQPFNFVLDSVTQIIETNSDKEITSTYAGYLIFGGDGGGEYIALEPSTGELVSLDICNADVRESRLSIAQDFSSFIELVGIKSEET